LRDLGIKPKRSMPKKLSSAGDDPEVTEKFLESGLEGTDLAREDDA
jgi:DNA recombination protein RmuC